MVPRYLTAAVVAAASIALASGAAAGARHEGGAVKLTATSKTTWMEVKGHIRISGTATPHPSGLTVGLEQRQGTSWVSVGNTKPVGASGAYSFIATAGTVGLTGFRVVTRENSAVVSASASVPIRVLHWTPFLGNPIFADAIPDPGDGDLSTDAVSSHGVNYTDAFAMDPGCYNQWDGNAWVDYMLFRKYESFTATLGIDSGAPSDQTATYSLIGGGKKLASGTLTYNSATKIKVSLDGLYRLRVLINIPDPYHAAGCTLAFPQVVFGDPQVLGP